MYAARTYCRAAGKIRGVTKAGWRARATGTGGGRRTPSATGNEIYPRGKKMGKETKKERNARECIHIEARATKKGLAKRGGKKRNLQRLAGLKQPGELTR